jgi:hypothetical protein
MNKGRRLKHPIATPFALLSLTAGVTCLALASPSHPHAFTTLGGIGTLLLIVGAVALLIPFFAWLSRSLCRCFREIMDCVWVLRRGVLNPFQVRQEFIETMGRKPTIAEVHDLHEMIKTEYNQAMLTLGGIVAAGYIFHRGVKGKVF